MATLDGRADEQASAWGPFSYQQRWLMGDWLFFLCVLAWPRKLTKWWETAEPQNVSRSGD